MNKHTPNYALQAVKFIALIAALLGVAAVVFVKYVQHTGRPYRNLVLIQYSRPEPAHFKVQGAGGKVIGAGMLMGCQDEPHDAPSWDQYYAFEWLGPKTAFSLRLTLASREDHLTPELGEEHTLIFETGHRMHNLFVIRIDETSVTGGTARCSLHP